MRLTAKEAWQIATDAAEIKAFREKLDAEIAETAKSGEKYHIAYIAWNVSQAAVEALAEEYRKDGFEVGYHDDSESKAGDNYYNRGFWLDWKKGGKT